MPTLTFDGVFDPQPRRLDITALDLQGFLDASYADLRAAFGPPSIDAVPDGAGAMWHIITPAGPVELFDYDNPGSPQEYPAQRAGWQLAADDLSALPWIYQHVLGSTEDFPRLTMTSDVVAITEAYILYLSHQAYGWRAKGRLGELEHFQANALFLPPHRGRMLLLDVLLGDEWAAADETQRQAWRAQPESHAAGRPGDPQYLSSLRAWHRWAVLTDWRGPGAQPVELATGLAALAEHLAERRRLPVGRAYYEIYRGTVAALAERAAEPDRIG
ncbi:hypothetical protein HS048_34810 [Planomonospora sp. ID91781]|uniref:hypothetical protein n=1 Tax=Planomonospora sp. ID91781 TaxID=2738135 RepID=UPI0018C3AD1C|nr:hypothetical protein [Planomonospora sp. ID91781]MBG0825857.1 hypothetical protein [Planomonospora sp. ID91781]